MTGVDWVSRFMPVCDALVAAHADRLRGATLSYGLPAEPCALHLGALLDGAGASLTFDARVQSGIMIGPEGHVTDTQTQGFVDLTQVPLRAFVEQTMGVGQAAVMAMLDVTNLQIAGRCVVVAGYSATGRSVANSAKAMGAVVTVVADDPVARVMALMEGFHVGDDDSMTQAEVVFCAQDGAMARCLGFGAELTSGVILCNVSDAAPLSLGEGRRLREHVTVHQLAPRTDVRVIAGGHPVHVVAGDGMPVQVRDVVLGLSLCAALQLMEQPLSGANALDPKWEDAVAHIVLAAERARPA